MAATVVPVLLQPVVPALVPDLAAGACRATALAGAGDLGRRFALLYGDARLLCGLVVSAPATRLGCRKCALERPALHCDLCATTAGARLGAGRHGGAEALGRAARVAKRSARAGSARLRDSRMPSPAVPET